MNCQQPRSADRRRQRGQSTIEYAIIATALVVCLFAATSRPGQDMARAIRAFYTDLTLFISLP